MKLGRSGSQMRGTAADSAMTAGVKMLIYLLLPRSYGLVPGICCELAAEYDDSFA